jgi:hypothetical protein
VGQLLIVLVALGLPVAITLAWYHGHHASRHVSGAEATIMSLASRPRTEDALTWVDVAAVNARVLAWAGAEDQATQLLEGLSTVDNGLAPAEITRDPLYDLPLAGNARYRALKAKQSDAKLPESYCAVFVLRPPNVHNTLKNQPASPSSRGRPRSARAELAEATIQR